MSAITLCNNICNTICKDLGFIDGICNNIFLSCVTVFVTTFIIMFVTMFNHYDTNNIEILLESGTIQFTNHMILQFMITLCRVGPDSSRIKNKLTTTVPLIYLAQSLPNIPKIQLSDTT